MIPITNIKITYDNILSQSHQTKFEFEIATILTWESIAIQRAKRK